MSKIDIQETSKTLRVLGDSEAGTLVLSGKSLPENAREFFEPILKWLNKLGSQGVKSMKVDMDIEYFNTSTSSIIFKILTSLKEFSKENEVKITWYFEEDDLEMEEVGQDFEEIIGEIFTIQSKDAVEKTNWVK